MGNRFAKMRKQAREFEDQIVKMREDLKQQVFEGQSGNGLVSLTIDGERNLKSIRIQPACVDPQDVEGLQDLIQAAFEDASQKQQAGGAPGSPFPFSFG